MEVHRFVEGKNPAVEDNRFVAVGTDATLVAVVPVLLQL